MPRTARASVGNICYPVINRGNNRAEVFHKSADYARLSEMFDEAVKRLPMRVLSWCLMPNHFHLVLWPYADGDHDSAYFALKVKQAFPGKNSTNFFR